MDITHDITMSRPPHVFLYCNSGVRESERKEGREEGGDGGEGGRREGRQEGRKGEERERRRDEIEGKGEKEKLSPTCMVEFRKQLFLRLRSVNT